MMYMRADGNNMLVLNFKVPWIVDGMTHSWKSTVHPIKISCSVVKPTTKNFIVCEHVSPVMTSYSKGRCMVPSGLKMFPINPTSGPSIEGVKPSFQVVRNCWK